MIEGRPVVYLASGEPLARSAREDVQGFDLLEDRDLQGHPRLRRVLTTLVRPTPRFYGVLHWSDGTDLDELDRRVLSDEASDADFEGALFAEPRTIVCLNCEAHIRALAVDPGQALFAKTLPERLRAHELKSSCPACSAALTVPIVEFLGGDAAP
jgi:hypothetical protein